MSSSQFTAHARTHRRSFLFGRILRQALLAAVLQLGLVDSSDADDGFGPRLQELMAMQQELMIAGGSGQVDSGLHGVKLWSEIDAGSAEATSVLLLYTDVACRHCGSVLDALDQRLKSEPAILDRIRLVHRHSGSLLDGVIVKCLVAGRGALYPSVFRMVAGRSANTWSEEEVQNMLLLSGQTVEPAACLTLNALEKSYRDFVDLLSVCDLSGCPKGNISIQGREIPALLPMTPVLYVGRIDKGSSLMTILQAVRGREIEAYLNQLR